jgi:hypothetical protein
MTVGPLFSMISSSEWMPTSNSLPSRRACSIAPAWPAWSQPHVSCYDTRCGQKRIPTMMAEIEAAVNPYPVGGDGDVVLGIHRPLARRGGFRGVAIGHDAFPISETVAVVDSGRSAACVRCWCFVVSRCSLLALLPHMQSRPVALCCVVAVLIAASQRNGTMGRPSAMPEPS